MSLKSLLWEDAPAKLVVKPAAIPAQTGRQIPIAPTVSIPNPPSSIQLPSSVTQVDATDDLYQKLHDKTDFTQLPIFLSIAKYSAPLATVITDERVRFRAAIAQAQTQDNIQPAAILSSFDDMQKVLAAEADKFEQAMVNATNLQVDAVTDQATKVDEQIKALQAQSAQMKEDAYNNSVKIQNARHRFSAALQTRQSELTSEQSKYSSLLT